MFCDPLDRPVMFGFAGLVDEDGNSEERSFCKLRAARTYAKRIGGVVTRLVPEAYGYERDETFGDNGVEIYDGASK